MEWWQLVIVILALGIVGEVWINAWNLEKEILSNKKHYILDAVLVLSLIAYVVTRPPVLPTQTTQCTYRVTAGGVLPDTSCTPGIVDGTATVSKICTTGYTDTVRPSPNYTSTLKRQQAALYGIGTDNETLRAYEEDHLIPLELGGHPTDPKNLWPEPGASPNTKDAIENELRHKVCELHTLSLSEAQRRIQQNWTTALND